MDLGLEGKVALVAASSKGLGLACATALAAEGAKVVMSARNEAELEAAAADVRGQTGAEVHAIPADVTKAEEIERLVSRTLEELGAIDVLVMNSGAPPLGTFSDLTDDQWRETFELVTLSLIRFLRLVTPQMRERKWGRVISIQSTSVKQPLPYLALSNGVRPGAAGVIKTLVDELAKDNVTINTVLPGTFLTERLRANLARTAERLELEADLRGDLLEPGHDCDGLVVRRRGDLRDERLAVAVDRDEVGERTTDVDANGVTHAASRSLTQTIERTAPPSTWIAVPVRYEAFSEARNATSAASSCGSPSRPRGTRLALSPT